MKSSRELFQSLEGQEFADYRAIHDAVLKLFNGNLLDFPPGYSYLQLLMWAKEQGWIAPCGSQGFRIHLTPAPI